jgi:Tol biopolymer transport system component/tRNA A-37 threonylcarbamoyl transferase component Bud32
MALSAGTRLGPYEILAPIGAGGMGEVYRARDPRMGREVAIKVSAERFSDRFEREVHAVAALNHPNICHLYDVGPNYLVMELVEGPTLAERIKEGALPLEEVLPIARQIADALEAAHEKGIIHRDLKPANIKIKPDGTIKVLDFGLAKMADQTTSTDPEISPTRAMEATRAGEILGTAAYMAPEQARGKTLDKRVDIWAFGVVLYEMLSGQRLFDGESVTDTLAAVLTKEPEWNRVPVKAQQLLRSCLEKDPKRRLRDIGDFGLLLDDTPVRVAAKARLAWTLAGVLALALAIALGELWRVARPLEATTQSVVRLDLDLGPDVSLASTTGPAVILSPDGTGLVFVSQGQDGTRHLFTRRLDQPKATLLAKTEGASAPFFSPDGQWVGFFAQGKLKKTRVDGGEPISLCDAPAGRGASWGDDGNIIAALDTNGGLSQVPPEGGKAVSVTKLNLEVGENTHRWPHVLPGGKAVLFNAVISSGNYDEAGIAVLSLKDHRTKTLLEHAGMYPRYLPSGHLLYVTKGTLFAVRFDPDRLELRGPATLVEEVASNPNVGSAQLDFSRSGTLAYRTGGAEGLSTIQWLDGAGKTVSLGTEPASYFYPRLSPDGSRLVLLVNQGATSDLWIYDWQRGSRTRLTNGRVNLYPVWSPDGRFVVFQSAGGMFWTTADGAGKPQPLIQSKTLQLPSSFTPAGTRLVFSELTPGSGAEIRTVPVESRSGQLRAGEPELFLKTATTNTFAAFSPNGRWLAYADAEAGSYEVYVRAFPDKGTKVQISNAGGTMPLWSRNGHELFYAPRTSGSWWRITQ